jgi:hypothetical protein
MNSAVTIRPGTEADRPLLRRLAALDSANVPHSPTLVAELDGQVLAAISQSDGRAVADPFQRTGDLVALLRARRRQLSWSDAGSS